MFTGPNIVRDGLVFGYDTGYPIISGNSDTYRFNLGEPTTNLASNANFSNGTTGWNANQNVTLSVETINGIRFLKVKSNQTNSTPGFLSSNITVSGNTTYTLTIKAYKNDSEPLYMYATGNGTGGSDIVWTPSPNGPNPITTELTTISRTFTTPSNMTYLQIGALWVNPLTTSEVYVEYMQLEQKSHLTPFTTGTRSATQSLIDLKESTNIDLSNVSFDSNAQLTFDGTDDEINTGITTQLTDFSCVVVFKNNNSAAWGRLVDKFYVNGFFISAYFASVGSGYVGAGIVEPNPPHGQALQYDTSKYNYFVVTRSGTTHTIYLNGSTNSASKTGSGAALSSAQMSIGAWYDTYNGQNYTGEIPVVKLYNRALSPKEIQQDFEAYKNRFGI